MSVEFTDITEQLPRDPEHPSYELRTPEEMRRANILAVHYDAERADWPYDPVERYKRQARYHMSKDWNPGPGVARGFGLMYHYRISPDGRLWRTQPEALVTWNANNANDLVIAVCADLGQGQKPTYEQVQTLQKFLDAMCYERPDLPGIRQGSIWGHGELRQFRNDTSCPGLLGPYVQRYRATGKLEAAVPVPSEPPPPPIDMGRQFPQTGYSVANPILRFFDEHGGVGVFGYPCSARRIEKLEDGKQYQVQWFQKSRLEIHPEIGPDVVMPGNIGYELLKLKGQR
jgi:hypothetical protein